MKKLRYLVESVEIELTLTTEIDGKKHIKYHPFGVDGDLALFTAVVDAVEKSINSQYSKSIAKLKINNRLFICDFCGKEKGGEIFSVYDENYNKQRGIKQCRDCFGASL